MEDKDRLLLAAFAGSVALYGSDKAVRYLAHWIWWDGDEMYVLPIGDETRKDGGGLESNPTKHPDQEFWAQKKLQPLPKGVTDAAIVTDCKLLPCAVKSTSCAYAVPRLVAEKFGSGIEMAVFCHKDCHKGKTDRYGYYTVSGASEAEVDEALGNLFRWDWDQTGDESDYL